MINKSNKTPVLLVGEGIPEFNAITHKEVEEQIPYLLKELNTSFNNLESELSKKLKTNKYLNWDDVMEPIYRINERLRWSWGLVSHLNSVKNSKELREAYSNQQSSVIRFTNKIGQSKILFESISNLKEQGREKLNQTQIRIIDAELLSMKQRGVSLKGSKKETFNINSEKLAKLSTDFSNNVLDATKEWSLLLTNKDDIAGLPQRTLEYLSEKAKEAGDKNKENNNNPNATDGPWRVGLDMPSYVPLMTYSSNRSLRENIYRAYVKRASHGRLNNEKYIEEILTLRQYQAEILGYKNWAELSLSSKMAKNVEEVENLLEELRIAAIATAHKEVENLINLAKEEESNESFELQPWDISFWSERLKEKELNLNQEVLRPWFPLPRVLEGLFTLCEKIFGIKISAADGEAPIWNEDVRFFKVKDNNNNQIAAFFLDSYSRPSNKRGGAWMDECLIKEKRKDGQIIYPIAYLICNQTPPSGKAPSLMSFDEVETLFHEFGHGLQHMLTTVEYPQAAGINNIEWDAVELPSQFMENWCLDRSTLMGLAKHWETGESLPEKEYESLRLSRKFNSGLATLRQVHFALTDIKLHSQWNNKLNLSPDDLRREIAKDTTVIPPISEDKFLCCFSHIFAGGYSAGYYSYKWAEVLSADAFAAFEEVGLNQIEEIKIIGKRFKETILSLGGSKSPKEIYKSFRGREAKTEALIRHSGLANES